MNLFKFTIVYLVILIFISGCNLDTDEQLEAKITTTQQ